MTEDPLDKYYREAGEAIDAGIVPEIAQGFEARYHRKVNGDLFLRHPGVDMASNLKETARHLTRWEGAPPQEEIEARLKEDYFTRRPDVLIEYALTFKGEEITETLQIGAEELAKVAINGSSNLEEEITRQRAKLDEIYEG